MCCDHLACSHVLYRSRDSCSLIPSPLTKTDGVVGSFQTLTNMTALETLFTYPHLLYNPQEEIHWSEMKVHIQNTVSSKEPILFSFSIGAEVSNMHSHTQNILL